MALLSHNELTFDVLGILAETLFHVILPILIQTMARRPEVQAISRTIEDPVH